MGKVYLDSTEIGTFDPQTEGTSGNILINATVIGTFNLAAAGYVLINSTIIGTYSALVTFIRIPQIRIEIFRGPPAFMDDNFARTGFWTKTSGGTSAFSTDGDLAFLDAGSVAWCTVEHDFGDEDFSSTIYPKLIARISELDSGGSWRVSARYDGAWHTIITDTVTGVFEGTIPAGKTVEKIEIAVGGAGKTCKFDYVAVCKKSLLVPIDTSQDPSALYEPESGLSVVRPLLEMGVAGADITFPNFAGAYTDEITKFDRIIIYISRKGSAFKKEFGGKITNHKFRGIQKEFFIDLECMGLGQQLLAPESLIAKFYDEINGRVIIKEAITKCSDLTDKFVDVDSEIDSTHSVDHEHVGDEVLPYDLINEISKKAKTSGGVVGFDVFVDPAGNVHTFKRGKYDCPVSLTDKIEEYIRSLDDHRIRNKITIYGVAEKPNDPSKDFGTDMTTPHKGSKVDQISASGQKNLYVTSTVDFSPGDKIWIYMYPNYEENVVDTVDPGVKIVCVSILQNSYGINTGVIVYPGWGPTSASTVITADAVNKEIGSRSVKVVASSGGGWNGILYHWEDLVNMNIFPSFNIFIRSSVAISGIISLRDSAFKQASIVIANVQNDSEFHFITVKGGRRNADGWGVDAGFNWSEILELEVRMNASVLDFWLDGGFFGDARFSAIGEDATSIAEDKIRWAPPQIHNELVSDAECLLKADSLIDFLKNVITKFPAMKVYGENNYTPGYRQKVVISNDSVDEWFRILQYRQVIEGVQWDSFLTLSNEQALIDYVYTQKTVGKIIAVIHEVKIKTRHKMRAPYWI